MDILKSNFQTLTDILFSANRQIVLSLPNISLIIAEALLELKRKKNLRIKIFIEINEQSYRTGYGEIEALQKLSDAKIDVLDKKDVNLYFIIVDSEGFFHFPKSRFTEEEGIAYDLFPMETNQVKTIKFLFDALDEDDEIEDEIIENIDPNVIQTIAGSIKVPEKDKTLELIKTISNDPPLKPEYNRKLSVYTAKFQFVELKFKGANLHVKKVTLPSKALPFKDAKLKNAIEANLRLFADLSEIEFMQPFFDLKTEVDLLRTNYLVHLKERDKNLIVREEKPAFESILKIITENVDNLKINMQNKLQDEIGKSRKSIAENLADFLRINTIEELKGLTGDTLEREISNYVSSIVSRIHFPSAKHLLEEISFSWFYYDLTWEDLNNEKVLKEMIEKKLISPEDQTFISEKALGVEDQIQGSLF
jgi:hypothetical protein